MREDRFINAEQMVALSRELEAAGFKHVACQRLVDPKWRERYRSTNWHVDEVMWTVSLAEYLIPMPQVKKLIEICERHGLTFWMRGYDSGERIEFYYQIVSPDSNVHTRM